MLRHSLLVAAASSTCLVPGRPAAQETPAGTGPDDLQRRLDAQDQRIRELEDRLATTAGAATGASGFEFAYDDGYLFRSTGASPFALRINGRLQFRYVWFEPDRDTYANRGTAAGGEPIDVTRRSDFEIERGRLEFRGTWDDPKLGFYINIDADTDDEHRAIFHDFWCDYEFSEAFHLHVGKAFVPGSREWLRGSTRTHLADRSMATTFFRPDRSLGVWASGEPVAGLHYRAMLANGFATADLAPAEVNDEFAYAASVWWDALGDYGSGPADLEGHEAPALQLGASVTFAPESGSQERDDPVGESRFYRLSDGSRLTELGVDSYRVWLFAIDAALKYRGLGLHGEAFLRATRSISPTGAPPARFPASEQDDWGGYLTAGYMVIPGTLEPVLRVSTVQGELADSWEYAAGVNWYVDGTHRNKVTLDVTVLDGVPVSNSGPDLRVGDDGVLVRAQWQIAF